MTRRLLLPIVFFLASAPLVGQQTRELPQGAPRSLRELTLESIFDPKSKVDFAGAPQNGFVWLAYYKEFNQQVPTVVATVMRDHHASLLRLFKDFTWEKASQYVKNKEWRKDNQKKQ